MGLTATAAGQKARKLPPVVEQEKDSKPGSGEPRVSSLPPLQEATELTRQIGTLRKIEESDAARTIDLPSTTKIVAAKVKRLPKIPDQFREGQPTQSKTTVEQAEKTPRAKATARISTFVPADAESQNRKKPEPQTTSNPLRSREVRQANEKHWYRRPTKAGDEKASDDPEDAAESKKVSVQQIGSSMIEDQVAAILFHDDSSPRLEPVAYQEPAEDSFGIPASRPKTSEPIRNTVAPQTQRPRHPLARSIAQRQELTGPPVTNTPHRTIFEPPQSDSVDSLQIQETTPLQIPLPPVASQPGSVLDSHPGTLPLPSTIVDDNLDLVQPPVLENRLRPEEAPGTMSEAMSREQFWNQFATLPEDKKGRTAGYDSIQAVLNNGFWFGGVDFLYLEPTFQENNAFTIVQGTQSSADHVDFGFDVSYKGYFGFETNAGPAFKASFWRLNNYSAINDISIGPGQTVTTRIDLGDSDNQYLLGPGASPGSRLTVQQQMKINSTELMIYKDQKNPVSRVRGNIGLRHISLQQLLFAGLDDPVAGSQVVRNFNDYFGAGPKIGIEYFRPIGHTDLELQSGFFGSLLFGRRDQIFDAAGTTPWRFEQTGKVETVSIFEMYVGVQWNIQVSKCQHVFVRTALESQLWAGSDTALDIGSDFGLYGMTFGFGITR